MRDFDAIWEMALQHHNPEVIQQRLPQARTADEIRKLPDSFFLSEMSRRIFQAGFSWSVVNNKWDEITVLCDDFDVATAASWPEEKIDALISDKRMIRHMKKTQAIRANAQMMLGIANEQGSFANWIADWPSTQITGLWMQLKKQGQRLGGMTGPIFLRHVGKDTFVLSGDVETALRREGVVEGPNVGTKGNLAKIEQAFAQWQAESELPLCQISMCLALSVGPKD